MTKHEAKTAIQNLIADHADFWLEDEIERGGGEEGAFWTTFWDIIAHIPQEMDGT